MNLNLSKENTLIYPLVFVVIVIYLYAFMKFFYSNAIWILALFSFIIFFLINNIYLKIKKIKNAIEIKKRDNRRINFWR